MKLGLTRRFLIATLLCSVNSILPATADAGQNQVNGNNQNPVAEEKKPPAQRVKLNYSPQILQKLPDFPYFPLYPANSVKFVRGITYPALAGQKAWDLDFNVKDSPQQVSDWYKSALIALGWTLSDRQCHGTNIIATKPHDGLQCMLSIRSTGGMPGFKSSMNFRFLICQGLP